MLHLNRVTHLLGIRYPIIQGGMAWVANASLASAVSNAGGLGIIAAGAAPVEVIYQEIVRLRQLTDKPFGVNLMMLTPYVDEVAFMLAEEKVPVITTGAGNASRFFPLWKEAGSIIAPVTASVSLAVRYERQGADLIIAEGCEAGGHIGELTTFALIPQMVDALSIPVIAAGGIADGRGINAAMMLGAEGVQLGTRFLTAHECTIHPNYKQMVLKATDSSTIVTGRGNGHPVRALKNKMTRNFHQLENTNTPFEELELLTIGSLRKAVIDGDVDNGSFMCGQIAGLVQSEDSCADIIDHLFEEAITLADVYLERWK